MGIFSRIRGLFSCLRSSKSVSLNDEENSRLFEPKDDSLQENSSSQAVASTSNSKTKVDVNYGAITTTVCPPKPANRVPNTSISQQEKTTTHVKPCYSLQTFISSLHSSLKGERKTPASDVIYLNEWTACTAVILDEFSRRLSPQHTVEVTSDTGAEFCDCELQLGIFQFSMKCCIPETITIFFNISKYKDINNSFTLSKKIHVRYHPCSNVQAEMTIKSIDVSSGNESVFQVSIVDVFGILTSHESCMKLDILSSGENEVIQKQMHLEPRHIYFDITVRGQRPWSRDLVVVLNGDPVPTAEKIEVFDKLRGLCSCALKNGNYESIPDFIEFYGSYIFIPLTTGDDDGTFVPYDEDNCVLVTCGAVNSHQLICMNAKKEDILGAGSAHIKNIIRVLKHENPIDIHEKYISGVRNVIFDLSKVHSCHHAMCKQVVQHLLRGLYYRGKASQAAAVRMEWKNRVATLVKLLGNCPSLRLCRFFRDHFGKLMNQYNREACDELFKFFNFQRDTSEVDLHGLLVADENKLKLLKLNDDVIKKFRLEGDEAIRKLEETFNNFDLEEAVENNTPWLEIIVGAGHHSRIKNEQKIRPKVEKFLKEMDLTFAAVNKGSLVVTFITYSGPEPCFGEYYCENCDKCWKSSNSYVGKCQQCFYCQANCWPVKQQEIKVDKYNSGVMPVKSNSKPHCDSAIHEPVTSKTRSHYHDGAMAVTPNTTRQYRHSAKAVTHKFRRQQSLQKHGGQSHPRNTTRQYRHSAKAVTHKFKRQQSLQKHRGQSHRSREEECIII